jgi:hypothetical protein
MSWIERKYEKYKMKKRHKNGDFRDIKLSHVVAIALTQSSHKTVSKREERSN